MNDPFATTPPDRKEVSPARAETGPHPEWIGRYRVERVLGTGTFGVVYLAHDEQLKRPVAIKVPHRHLLAQAVDAEAYLTEARTVASLDHPHIVRIYDVGSTEQFPFFIVAQYIDGTDLAKRQSQYPLPLNEGVNLVAAVADALHYAHKRGLVHRDIKPANLILDGDGRPFVGDFGLALREQDVGKGPRYAGTPAYMSPEQARGEGHRVDGRSDIFSLGVVLYELMTRRRPFQADTQSELLEQITNLEARPPRMIDDRVAKELDRICLKALSKRAADRYSTAKDMADDLRHFLEEASTEKKTAVIVPVRDDTDAVIPKPDSELTRSDQRALKIVPKGLRSFEARDADFFLELLPGPRDRDGLPESIRFWKTHIGTTDPDSTFSAGLIYGPSGCGKSSLVKAGLLPRLSKEVTAIYVEATAEETEARLVKGLGRHVANLPSNLGLVESLMALRRGQFLKSDQKVLLVLDQFEQWLHTNQNHEDTELVRALRQCDGRRLQCIVMVRDDFWLAVSRFMQALEIRVVEAQNSRLVDLFDLLHARKVLSAYGRAYGRLPENLALCSKEQEAFLDQTVAGLAQDSKVISVRLALFAEMVKGKPWTLGTLKEIGGLERFVITFLEETFAASTAPPPHRLHQRAVQAVLKALLPEAGTDIKGHMRSRQELLEASSYTSRPKDFADLLGILDAEIRLITPTDPEGKGVDVPRPVKAEEKYYQLTHDYLVPSLRDWLTRKQKETRQGRAELRLAERVGLWKAKPESRHLPSWWEWLTIRFLTRKKDWTGPQRKMMRSAARYHARRGATLAVCLVLLGWLAWEGIGSIKAQGLLDRLLNANTADVPAIVIDMGPYRRWVNPLLRTAHWEAKTQGDVRNQLYASLALLPTDPGQAEYLYVRLLDAEPVEVLVIRDAIFDSGHARDFVERLWSIAEHPPDDHPGRRLCAACALATYDQESPRWSKVSRSVAEQLVAVNPMVLAFWIKGFRPVKSRLLGPLSNFFRDRTEGHSAERNVATSILVEYASDQLAVLTELIQDADEKQFAVLFPKVAVYQAEVKAAMSEIISRPLAAAKTDEEKETLARRQANAAVVLLRMGQPDQVWPLLQHRINPTKLGSDPTVRSYLIHKLGPLGVQPGVICQRLLNETDVSIRRALLLVLGELGPDQPTPSQREKVLPQVWKWYGEDPDAGIHGAADWLLRQWGQGEQLKAFEQQQAKTPGKQEKSLAHIKQELTQSKDRQDGYWYINSQAQTFVVVPGPVQFLIGSPPTEKGREGTGGESEEQQLKKIGRSFAIAVRHTTVGQFRRFLDDIHFGDFDYDKVFSPNDESPINKVNWYQAAQYCNWLSQQEGIDKKEWCYLPNAKGEYAEGMTLAPGYLGLTGYRLPTEAEWEYACRAGAPTSRFCGETEELLTKYAWFTKNSLDRGMLPGKPNLGVPGGVLKPNDLGLFDMLGNAWTWCQDTPRDYIPGEDAEDENRMVTNKQNRILRGGSFVNRAIYVRSAQRFGYVPALCRHNVGFRPARTIR